MTDEELRNLLLEAIDKVAPGCVPAHVDDAADIRDEMDLDSMDLLNLAGEIHERLNLEIPDVDMDQMTTIATALAYLQRALRR